MHIMCSGELTRVTPAPVFDVSGGILAEEMGLGKTVELVAYAACLFVCLFTCLFISLFADFSVDFNCLIVLD